jgi:crossover junction endonuclease EME1
MTEVIILSSSPPRATGLKAQSTTTRAEPTLPHRNFDFGFDDLEDVPSLDFSSDRPSKRVRVSLSEPPSSPPRHERSRHVKGRLNLNFDSSSEKGDSNDVRPATTTSRLTTKTSTQTTAIDDIIFSSSAPVPSRHGPKKGEGTLSAGRTVLEDFFDDDSPLQADYDAKTANLLANLDPGPNRFGKSISKPAASKRVQSQRHVDIMTKPLDDIESSSPVKAKASKSKQLTEEEKAVKDAQRASAKAVKDIAKEAEKAKKQADKAQKERDKQRATDLAEVNKLRTNKKVATPEMILEMPISLQHKSLGNQLESLMEHVQVEVNYIDEVFDLIGDETEHQQYGNIITWRRKVNSTYNDDEDQWEPNSGSRVVKENHILIHLPASDFAALAAVTRTTSSTSTLRTEAEMKANLDAHVISMRRRFGECVPIYLLEGLREWLKKNLNTQNRAYATAVRAQMQQEEHNIAPNPSQAGSRRRKKQSETLDLSHVTSEVIENLLLHLQLAHQPILIHHTPTASDSAAQISELTQQLSTRPYRHAQLDYNLKSASFCMDRGQVKTGDNAEDTFAKMLQEVNRITPSMALGIVKEYGTIRRLVKGFDKHGNLLLEDVRKAVNKDGGWSDKRLGPQASKRLFKVFMGRDPSATDGMS